MVFRRKEPEKGKLDNVTMISVQPSVPNWCQSLNRFQNLEIMDNRFQNLEIITVFVKDFGVLGQDGSCLTIFADTAVYIYLPSNLHSSLACSQTPNPCCVSLLMRLRKEALLAYVSICQFN